MRQREMRFINYKDGRNCDCLQPGCPYCDSDETMKKLRDEEISKLNKKYEIPDDDLEKFVNPVESLPSLWSSFWGTVWLGCKEIFKYD